MRVESPTRWWRRGPRTSAGSSDPIVARIGVWQGTARCTRCTQASQGAGLRTGARRHPSGWRVSRRSLNVKGATALVTGVRLSMCGLLRGVRTTSRESAASTEDSGESPSGAASAPTSDGRGNAMNPMTGSGMQQARGARVEQAVEVVENHEDGTRSSRWVPARRRRCSGLPRGRRGSLGVDTRVSSERSAHVVRRPWLRPGRSCGLRAREMRTVEGRTRIR